MSDQRTILKYLKGYCVKKKLDLSWETPQNWWLGVSEIYFLT